MSENSQKKRRTQTIAVILVLLIMLIATGCGGRATPTEAPPAAATDTPVANTPTAAPTPVPTLAATPTVVVTPTIAAAVEESTPVAVEEAIDQSYPAPVEAAATAKPQEFTDYPAPEVTVAANDSYPAPVTATPETSRIPIVPFVMERPLATGATVVRGTGPANVPIVVADIFLMGEVLGEGVIDADGHFEVAVPPLETSHWVGIALGDLSGTDLIPEDFFAHGFRGEGAEQVPQVGFMYDSDIVQ